jgi:hypothetical protein
MISLSFILFYFLELLGSLYLIIGCPPSTSMFVLFLIFTSVKLYFSLILFIVTCIMDCYYFIEINK